MDQAEQREMVTVRVRLTVDGHDLEAGVRVPAGPARPRDVLGVLQNLTDAVVSVAEQATPEKVSCRKGCGACCRQMVPISPAEAHHLAALMGQMAPSARAAVDRRWAESRRRLQQAGVWDALQRWQSLGAEAARALDVAYFGAGAACPFLAEEACTIHAQRPLACREYLVTSPAEACTNPRAVRQLPLGAKVSNALRGEAWVPLILTLDYARNTPEEPPHATGAEVLSGVLARL